MKKPTFAPWPGFDREIIDAVERVLRSGKVSQWTGPNVYAFEKEYRITAIPNRKMQRLESSFIKIGCLKDISELIAL